jgi:hypothetical protein
MDILLTPALICPSRRRLTKATRSPDISHGNERKWKWNCLFAVIGQRRHVRLRHFENVIPDTRRLLNWNSLGCLSWWPASGVLRKPRTPMLDCHLLACLAPAYCRLDKLPARPEDTGWRRGRRKNFGHIRGGQSACCPDNHRPHRCREKGVDCTPHHCQTYV